MSRYILTFTLCISLTACSPQSRLPATTTTAPATNTPVPEVQVTQTTSDIYAENIHLFDYDAGSPVQITENSVQQEEGYTVHDISYPSPKGGDVPAYLVIPDGDGPFAGILLMHGSSGSRESLLDLAKDLVHTDAVVMTISGPSARTQPGLDSLHGARP